MMNARKKWPVPAHLKFAPGDDLDCQFGFILGRTEYLVRKRLLARLRENGYAVTKEELVILARLYEEDGLTQTEISERTVKNKATVTRLLETMVRKSLVRKQVDKIDGRKFRVHLRPRGTKAMEFFLPLIFEFMEQMTRDIPRRDMEITTATMKKIYDRVLSLS